MAATVCTCHVDAQQHHFGRDLRCTHSGCCRTWKQHQKARTDCGTTQSVQSWKPKLSDSMARGLRLLDDYDATGQSSTLAELGSDYGFKPAGARKALRRARDHLARLYAWEAVQPAGSV